MHKVSDLVVDLVSRVVSKKKPLQLRKGLIVVALLVGGYSLPGINLTTYLQCQKISVYWLVIFVYLHLVSKLCVLILLNKFYVLKNMYSKNCIEWLLFWSRHTHSLHCLPLVYPFGY